MRTVLLIALLAHILLFLLTFAIVGFVEMLVNLTMSAWVYSCFLTVRETCVIIYIVLTIFASLECTASLFQGGLGNLQLFGKMINLASHCFLVYLVTRAYYFFRKSGGLHGTKGISTNLISVRPPKTDTKTDREVI